MKKFAFSLQYLLDAHAAREQAAEQALQLAIRERIDAERGLEKVQAARGRQVVAMEKISGVVKRGDLATLVRNLEIYDREVTLWESQCAARNKAVENCRNDLRKERTARLQLENLCEREREEWVAEMQVMEQKQMDETAAGRWHRQEMMR
ncbi:MAG: flagellar FliJ family protein [Pontiellaceae bacterium]|nr:flagellar FliJ family protein [Pontiellaceae bacterium]MBN2784114.1 flagellar FliJ family protein [Pontiellaceae bacterium]